MSSSFVLDPRSQAAANAPLELFRDPRGAGVYVTGSSWPDPEQENVAAQGREGEILKGRPRIGNRRIALELYVTESDEPAATNLVTNPNPELTTTGYAAQAGGTFAIVDGGAFGEKGLEITAAASGDGISGEIVNVAGSRSVYGLIWAKVALGSSFRVSLVELTAASAVVGQTDVDFVGAGEWRAYRVSRAFGATGVKARLRTTALGALVYRADAFLISDGVDAVYYFDGDSPGARWTGAAGGSSSTRLAPGGPRMDRIYADLEEKLEKLRDEKGTISRPSHVGRLTFDVETARGGDGELNGRQYRQGGQKASLELEARPYGRGASSAGATVAETTKPVLEIIQAAPAGGAWSLGELELTEASAIDRMAVVAGVQVADFDNAAGVAVANTETYLQAEALTGLSAASGALTGAQGGNAMLATLGRDWAGVISTQKSGGGADLAHVGDFAVWARVYTGAPLGRIAMRLAYAQSDLLVERMNDAVVVPASGNFALVNLGTVRLARRSTGSQRWRGRILAKSSVAGDTLYVDDLRIIPCSEAYFEAVARLRIKSPDSYVGRDEFAQSAGALAGKTPAVGTGNWSGTGDADDFTVDATNKRIQRTAVSDSSGIHNGRLARLGTGVAASVFASVDLTIPTGAPVLGTLKQGLFTRFQSSTSFAAAYLSPNIDGKLELVVSRFSGVTETVIANLELGSYSSLFAGASIGLGMLVTPAGQVLMYRRDAFTSDPWGDPIIATAPQSVLATGGGNATGGYGILDSYTSATPLTRLYDNFAAHSPTINVALFASKKAYWRHDRYERDDSAGTGRTALTPEGDLLLIPPARREGRYLRLAAFASRGDLGVLGDNDPGDDLSGKLTTTPRYPTIRA